MKNLLLTAVLLSVTTIGFCDEIRVYTDYKPVRIQRLLQGADGDLEASKAGNKGKFKVITEADINKWQNDQEKEESVERVKKAALKQAALDKLKALGLTDEDLSALRLIKGE